MQYNEKLNNDVTLNSDSVSKKELNMSLYYDVIIIGGGVIGSFISYNLSKHNIKVCLLEKEADLAMEESGANSGIVHAGFDAKPGTNKAKFNLIGNEMMEQICKDLDVPFERNGATVLAFSDDELKLIYELYERGIRNGVKNLSILNRKQIMELEPLVSDKVCGALYAPTSGIVSPFELTLAASEVAYQNGVDYFFEHKVMDINKIKNEGSYEDLNGDDELFEICCNVYDSKKFTSYTHTDESFTTNTKLTRTKDDDESFENNNFSKFEQRNENNCHSKKFVCKFVINAAGVHADKISNMVNDFSFKIIPRKGEYILLDKKIKEKVNTTIFQVPSIKGKGVLVSRTVEGNTIVGPNSTLVQDPSDDKTTQVGLSEIWELALKSVPSLDKKDMIRSFAGIRSTPSTEDFIIGESLSVKGFFQVSGIESPGLTSAPAIGMEIERIIISAFKNKPTIKEKIVQKRVRFPKLCESIRDKQKMMILQNPDYANIICRCENVTLAEIIDSVTRPLGATTVAGVKLRTRAGMGRCQSGFCLPKILEIIAKQTNKPVETIALSGTGSEIIKGKTR